MKSIFKYQLPKISDNVTVRMPLRSEILSVQVQDGKITLWAMVDSSAMPWDRTFTVVGTGHPADELNTKDYIGTVQMPNGLVWHIFETGHNTP